MYIYKYTYIIYINAYIYEHVYEYIYIYIYIHTYIYTFIYFAISELNKFSGEIFNEKSEKAKLAIYKGFNAVE